MTVVQFDRNDRIERQPSVVDTQTLSHKMMAEFLTHHRIDERFRDRLDRELDVRLSSHMDGTPDFRDRNCEQFRIRRRQRRYVIGNDTRRSRPISFVRIHHIGLDLMPPRKHTGVNGLLNTVGICFQRASGHRDPDSIDFVDGAE